MFNDINEAKDAIDGLADHLDQEAGVGRGDAAAATAPPDAEPPETFTLEGLKEAGFEGFLTFGELLGGRLTEVPSTPGITSSSASLQARQ